MKRSWKRVTAGIMALSMVTGSVPFEPISQAVTSWTAIMASADSSLQTATFDANAETKKSGTTTDGDVSITFSGRYNSSIWGSWLYKLGNGEGTINLSATNEKKIKDVTVYLSGQSDSLSTNPESLKANNTVGTYNAEGQVLSFTNVNSNDVNLISPHEYYLVKKIVVTYEAVSTKTALTTENTTVTMATNSADVASVVVGETTLSATTDYTVSYKQGETDLESAPTEPGTYTAVITGTGDYEGSVEKAFEIKAVTYDITAVKSYGQTVNTDFGSVRTSASGDNYVYYATAKNGYEFLNWTYIVDGIEKTSTNSPLAINYNYAAPTAHFVKASTKTTLTAENTTVTMATNSADVESVVVGETTLTTNDYTVTYQDSQVGTIEKPTEPGTYTAVITGTGNYDGSVTKEFTIPTVVTTIEQLKAAVDEGGTGGLIKLGADITSTSKVDFETASTLDLNGHHLTLKYLNSYTDLVIQDSAENGTLTLTDNGYVIGVYGSNSVTIESGAIEFASIGAEGINIFDDGFVTINGGTVTSAGYSIRRNKGTVTINGGTITGGFYSDGSTNDTLSITGGTFSFDVTSLVAEGVPVEHIGDVWAVGDSIAENTKVVTTIDELKAAVAAGGLIKLGEDIISSNSKVDFKKASTLDLNGHNLTLKYLTARADLVIKDSVGNGKLTIPGGGYAILVCGDISVTIESGAIEFTDTWSYGFKIDTNDGSVTINGGTITSAGYSISRNKGAVTITGGSITGGFDDEFANDTLSITGGTFSFDVTSLLTDGYTATKDGDLWVVGQQTKTSIENATVTMATNSADVASVVVGETTLIEGTDYSVAYKQGETDLDEAPTEVGDYTAVITGLDNYQGTVTKDFSIKTEIDDAVITLGENSSEVKTVVLGETELTEDTDYTVSYEEDGEELEEAPTAPGSYTVVITGTGGYIGTATEDFVIKPDVKDADITLAANSPDVDSVEYDGDEVPDTEYIISYKNLDGDTISKPQVGGTYVVVITGIGDYTGTQSMEFTFVTYTKTEASDPTCTEDGNIEYYTGTDDKLYTDDEGTLLTDLNEDDTVDIKDTVIEAKGHTEGTPVTENLVDPTCTEEGSYDLVTYCTECGEELSRETITIDPIGHEWSAPTYTWSWVKATGEWQCTAKRTCSNDETHIETETATVTSEITTPATCTAMGKTTYTATFKNTAFETQIRTETDVAAKGHNWTIEWYWPTDTTAIAYFTCTEGDANKAVRAAVTSEEIKTSTCTVNGAVLYTATVTFEGETYTSTNIVSSELAEHEWKAPTYTWKATANGYKCEALRICKNCNVYEREEAVATYEVITEPTVSAKGVGRYTVTFSNSAFETQTKDVEIAKTTPNYADATYTWADDYSTVTAVKKCLNGDDSDAITETVETTSEVTKEATCTAKGETTYYAVFENDAFEAQEKTVENIEATGHTYGEPEWILDKNNNVFAKFTCENGDDEQIIKATVTSKTTDPTYVADGKTVYLATVKFGDKTYTNTRTVAIDKLTYTAPTVTFEKGENAVKLNWTKIKGAESYAVVAYVNGSWEKLAEGNTDTYTIKNLTAGKQYKVAVITKLNGKWFTDVSNAIVVTPKEAVTPKYPVVKSVDVEGNAFRLTWDAVKGAEKYCVAYYSAGKWKLLAQTTAKETTFTKTKVPAGSYKVVVGAKINGEWDISNLNQRAVTVTIK